MLFTPGCVFRSQRPNGNIELKPLLQPPGCPQKTNLQDQTGFNPQQIRQCHSAPGRMGGIETAGESACKILVSALFHRMCLVRPQFQAQQISESLNYGECQMKALEEATHTLQYRPRISAGNGFSAKCSLTCTLLEWPMTAMCCLEYNSNCIRDVIQPCYTCLQVRCHRIMTM